MAKYFNGTLTIKSEDIERVVAAQPENISNARGYFKQVKLKNSTHIASAELKREYGNIPVIVRGDTGVTPKHGADVTDIVPMPIEIDDKISAVAIVNELDKTPGLNIAEASVQLVQAKLLEEVNKFENFSTISPEELLRAVVRNTDAQTKIARVKLEYERGYKKGLFEAAKTVETEGKKAGWSDERVEFVKAKIMNLKVAYDEKTPEK